MEAAFAAVDKVEREAEDRTREKLREAGVGLDDVDRVMALFSGPGLDTVESEFGDRPDVAEALERLRAYLSTLDAMGLGDFVEVDLAIVRGLAYYTGIVFELFDRQGELRAICGGGRYDRLLELVGGEPLPAVGFGMGDVVLGELLAERGLVPPYRREVDYFVVVIGEEQRPRALGVAHELRDRGRSVLYALREQSVRKQFKAAETEGARQVLVLGPEEAAKGVVSAAGDGDRCGARGPAGRAAVSWHRDEEETARLRAFTARAARRLDYLEWLILAGAVGAATVGGALVALLVTDVTGVSFRLTGSWLRSCSSSCRADSRCGA